MNTELLFGTAYYPEYIPYNRIYKDIRMMKQIGMNVIRVGESTWSTIEPHDGVFDFSYLEGILKAAEDEKMKIIVGTPTYAIPSWLQRKDPDVMVMKKNGRTMYGHRQLIDIINPTFLYHAERIIRKLIEQTAGHPSVIGFQIDNETKHYENTSLAVQERFKNYLVDKFKTTDNLNKAFGLAYWSNAIHDWNDLPDIKGCVNGGLAGEFEAFQRSLVTEYLNWQAGIVAQYKKEEQFITHNFDFEWKKFGADIAQDGYSYGIQPDVNHKEAARKLTIAGTDIYHPTQDELTGAEISFCGDEIRGLKSDNYLVLECQAQAFKNWTPYPGQLRLHAYSHLASGASGMLYWNWHSIHNGYETYWKGLLSHDLDVNPAYEEAGVFGEEWKRLGREHLCISKKNSIALVVDNRSLTAFKWFPIDRELSYNDVVRWMYDSLYEMNIECDVIHAAELKTEDYKVIITPALYCADNSLLAALDQFVANGGILISTFKSFAADSHCSVYHDRQPHAMNECFGINYNQFTEPGKTRICGKRVKYFAELLNVDKAEILMRYEHPYWKKYAAITSNSYKKGKAFYIGCYTSKEIVKKVYADALKDYVHDFRNEWPVIIRSGINKLGKQIHYVMNYSDLQQVFRCPYESVKELVSGNTYKRGDEIKMKDWDVLIFERVIGYTDS